MFSSFFGQFLKNFSRFSVDLLRIFQGISGAQFDFSTFSDLFVSKKVNQQEKSFPLI